MNTPTTSDHPVSLRIPLPLRTALSAIAARHNLPFPVLVRAVLTDYVTTYSSNDSPTPTATNAVTPQIPRD